MYLAPVYQVVEVLYNEVISTIFLLYVKFNPLLCQNKNIVELAPDYDKTQYCCYKGYVCVVFLCVLDQ